MAGVSFAPLSSAPLVLYKVVVPLILSVLRPGWH